MSPDLISQWLAALRSDTYQQGYCHLKKGDKYCCLGVLAQITNASEAELNRSFPSDDFLIQINLYYKTAGKYAKLNDSGKTFHQIASIIEQDIPELTKLQEQP